MKIAAGLMATCLATTALAADPAVPPTVPTEQNLANTPGAPVQPGLPTQIVDALNTVFGAHPGIRANHAKGIVVTGHFVGDPSAASVTKAALFDGSTIPVTVRFSNSTGIPALPDGAGPANPHGMAIKYHAPGHDVDMVINSLKYFPVATGAEFRDLLQAIAASPPEAPKPTKLQEFVAAHPAMPGAFASATTPDSFADETYNGVDAFIFVDAAGKRTPFRLVVSPEHAVHLDTETAAKQPPDFLMQELPARLGQGPVTFTVGAQVAEPGDSTVDPTKPWPDSRRVQRLGVLILDKAVADNDAAQKKLLFLPTNLQPGIEPSDDPIIGIRTGSYAVSYARRLK